ncbi:MAG: hypothetical protein Q9222_002249 [Ikaeria aurantiellina]
MEVAGGVLAIVGGVAKLSKSLNEVRESYNSVALNIQLAAIQLSTIRDALEAIAEWRLNSTTDTKSSRSLDATLAESLKGCAVLITVIDGKVGEAGYTPGLKRKIRYMWLENVLQGYMSNLDGQVRALQLLLTSFQWWAALCHSIRSSQLTHPSRTITEQMQRLEHAEARSVFDQVRADTASLTIGNKDLEDAASVLSFQPSIDLAVDEILLQHPAYKAAYPNRRPRPKRVRSSRSSSSASSRLKAKAQPLDIPENNFPRSLPIQDIQSQGKGDGVPMPEQKAPPRLPPPPPPPRRTGRRAQPELRRPSFESTAVTPPVDQGILGNSKDPKVENLKEQVQRAEGRESEDQPKDHGQNEDRTEDHREREDRKLEDPSLSSAVEALKGELQNGETLSAVNNIQKEFPRDDPVLPNNAISPDIERSTTPEREETHQQGKFDAQLAPAEPSDPGHVADVSTSPIIKRAPSTDSDLYESSIAPKRTDPARTLKSASSNDTDLYASSLAEKQPPLLGTQDAGVDRGSTSRLAESKPLANNEDGDAVATSSASPNLLQAAADLGSSEETDVRPRSNNEKSGSPQRSLAQPRASRASTEGSSIVSDQASQSNMARRQSGPPVFRKPVPANSLRRSELVSSDYVKYSNAEQHGLKIVLNGENNTRSDSTMKPSITVPPTRPPPPVPPNPPGTLSPSSTSASQNPFRRLSNEISSTRPTTVGGHTSSTTERDESINETLSTISSSDRSDRQTLSSVQTSDYNTATTYVAPPSDTLKGQAQNDLYKLQLELSAAKKRGDANAQKATLQQSMAVIKKAYLTPVSQGGKSNSQPESPGRAKSSRMSLVPKKSMLSIVGRKSRQADLHEAARTGDNDTLRALLENKVSTGARGDDVRTPQMEAATRSHLHCLETLKEFQADEFAIDRTGRNVLHLAVVANQRKAVSWLIDAYPPDAPDMPGKKSSRLAWATEAITGSRSSKILREASDGHGFRPLHFAARLGLADMVALLLDKGADINAQDNWDRTSLINAVMLSRTEIVEILLARNADIMTQDVDGMTALHYATETNNLGILTMLLTKGNERFAGTKWAYESFNKHGDLPIHSAVRRGHIEPTKLLKGERQISELPTKHGESLIHIAALANQLALTKELLQGNADVNTWAKPQSYHLLLPLESDSGYSAKALALPYNIIPLHYACTRGYYEMTELLLENGAWVNAAPDDDDHGKSPLMMAVESRNTNLVCLLLARGAKVNAAVPATLVTALHLASKQGDLETTQELVRYGAKTAARTKELKTPEELLMKIKDPKKKRAMAEYYGELTRQRYAKMKAQMAENRPNGTAALPPQPSPHVYQQTTTPTPYSREFMDFENDAFPEAPPAYTPGSNVPRNLVNRPAVHRPQYGHTTARWICNEKRRLAERYLIFDVQQLKGAAARSIDREVEDVASIRKLAEGGFNRTFVIAFHDGHELVARLPYPCTVPRFYATASEVATMDLARHRGIPVPEVYGYSPDDRNPVGSEYIIMEKVAGTRLGESWYQLTSEQGFKIMTQIVRTEAKLFSTKLPASGSLYYKKDLNPGVTTIPVPEILDERLCIGPSVHARWWLDERASMSIDRGPFVTSRDVLRAAGTRELAWMQQHAQPRFPSRPVYQEIYGFSRSSPEEHMKHLSDYLRIADILVPDELAFNDFFLRHPDLRPDNLFVSESMELVSVIDWQHAHILPLFLNAGIPYAFQNHGDDDSEDLKTPKLPDDFAKLTGSDRIQAEETFRRRDVHFYYQTNTLLWGGSHFAASTDPHMPTRQRLFTSAGTPWEGDKVTLKANLIGATKDWMGLFQCSNVGQKEKCQCPITYCMEDQKATLDLMAGQNELDDQTDIVLSYLGIGMDGWVPVDDYDKAKQKAQEFRKTCLNAADTELERDYILNHYPFDDHDESGMT